MKSLSPYLIFEGNCEEAFNFYKSIFGGEFTYIGRFGEIPGDNKVPKEMQNKIMHISLPIAEGVVLSGSDNGGGVDGKVLIGNNVHLSLVVESKQEADSVFAGLSSGGLVTMPMADTFWGSYFGMLTDKFGFQWMISFETMPQ